MKTGKIPRNLLIICLGFLSLGAFYGGITLILKPDGSILQMPVELMERPVFQSYLIPGIVLLVIFGILPVFLIAGLLTKPQISWLNALNLIKDHHFVWTFTIYIGIGQIIWIDIQTLILNQAGLIHVIFSGLGILIVCISLLPGVRNMYKLI
jgi:hypothetical protein